MMNPSPLIKQILNHLLNQASWATQRLQTHAGKHLRIEGLPFPILLSITGSGLFENTPDENSSPDVTITLPDDFVSKVLVDRGNLFSSARLSGSADLAETLAFVFRNLTWDAEADLARVIGDIPAYRLSRWAGQCRDWVKDSQQRALQNVVEYAQEDSDWLPHPRELKAFQSDISRLRDDVERLEKRIAKLGA